jgi:hypothetical protein
MFSKNTQKTTKVETTTNLTTGIVEVNRIEMSWFVWNQSLWNWRDSGISSLSVTRFVSPHYLVYSDTDNQAILRCLYAYFLALPQQELPYISVSPSFPSSSSTEK